MAREEEPVTPPSVLQTLMEKWGVTSVDDLAAKIGMPARSLYRWQSGKHKPNFASTIELLEQADVLRWDAFEFENPDRAGRYLEHLTYEWSELISDVQSRYEAFEAGVAEALAEMGGEYAERAEAILTTPWTDRSDGVVEGPPRVGQLLARLQALEEKVAELPTAADLQSATKTLQEAIDRLASEGTPAARQGRTSVKKQKATP